MSEHTFDSFRRRAAAVTRRGALLFLGGAALATGLASASAQAARDNKKDKRKAKKVKKKFRRQCSRQRDQCRAFLLGTPTGPGVLFCCDSCFSDDVLLCLADSGF
jgi:hypothetical protein